MEVKDDTTIFGPSGLKGWERKDWEGTNLRVGDWRDTFTSTRLSDGHVEMPRRQLQTGMEFRVKARLEM